jgi:hypothetical protein
VGRRERTSSVCHSAVISGANGLFQPRHLLLGHGNLVESREKLADPPPLEHHRPPRHLRRMRGKDRHNENPSQPLQSLLRANPHPPHLA